MKKEQGQINFKPIKQMKVSTMITEQIKSHILNGTLHPGDALPSERELMSIFNVSRTSLREALKILDVQGYVTIQQRKRTRIKSLFPEKISTPIRILLKNDMKTVMEVMEVRKYMESWNAYYAALRATETEIRDLGKNLAGMVSKIKNRESHIQEDTLFHRAISMMTHNRIQNQLICSIDEIIQECIGVLGYERQETTRIIREHDTIYQAIRKRDAELARQMMDKHLHRVQSKIGRIYAEKKAAETMPNNRKNHGGSIVG